MHGSGRTTLFRCFRYSVALLMCGFPVDFSGLKAPAQITAPSSAHLPDSAVVGDGNDPDWNGRKEVLEKLRVTREKERQRRIVDDANRLVELTALYRKSVEEHGTPTPDDQKLLAQIEKLAREVKDRMRGM